MAIKASIKNDFAEWYQEVIAASELVDQSPTKGCMVIRPYGYAIWEEIQKELDRRIKEEGVQNAYFPLLIPESFLSREAEHIEGFSPELAVVTHAGGKKLEEPLVVRPTSETIIYFMFEKWLKSWRDLPLKINQWANVVRWEMRTRPFLRTTEFLWQEGHTAHYDHDDAEKMALTMLNHYKEFAEKFLAIPVVTGLKTDSERFAGAEKTYSIEGLMQDGKALQMGTSHILALSFPEAFDVKFQDKDGQWRAPYCTSWGMTTRLIGAAIMVHGDQDGLIIPPKIAPYQAVIVPIFRNEEDRVLVMAYAKNLQTTLRKAGMRIHLDESETDTPGAKYFHWEVRGVPVRIEVGPRDVAANAFVAVNRIESDKAKKKQVVASDNSIEVLSALFETIQNTLFARAQERLLNQTFNAETFEDVAKRIEEAPGYYRVGWCESRECEAKVKEIKATTRCKLEVTHKKCFVCGLESKRDVLVAKAY